MKHDGQAAWVDFISRDPITQITRAPYGHTGGNPLNGTDPSGLCFGPDVICNAAGAIRGAAAAGAGAIGGAAASGAGWAYSNVVRPVAYGALEGAAVVLPPQVPAWFTLGTGLFSALLVSMWLRRSLQQDAVTTVGVGIVLSLVLSPHIFRSDYLTVGIALVIWARRSPVQSLWAAGAIAVVDLTTRPVGLNGSVFLGMASTALLATGALSLYRNRAVEPPKVTAA